MADIEGGAIWKVDIDNVAFKCKDYTYRYFTNDTDTSHSEASSQRQIGGVDRLEITLVQANLDDIEFLYAVSYHVLIVKAFYHLKVWQDARGGALCLECELMRLISAEGRGEVDGAQPTTLVFKSNTEWFMPGTP